MTVRVWRCRRVKDGVSCDTLNLRTKIKCSRPGCTGRRPKPKRPPHMNVLDIPYEVWVARFGEVCGICGAPPKPGKRLCREHGHTGDGVMRGLACFRCNRMLGNKDAVWLRAAAAYLERSIADSEAFPRMVCVYCGQGDGHSLRCSVTKFGVAEHTMPEPIA